MSKEKMNKERKLYFEFKPMADDLRKAEHWEDLDGALNRNKTMQNLYKMGYRKQSENTVEVVRCKDCRWFQRENWDGEILYGCDCSSGMNDITPDDYCSCGEPKMKDGE